jgi:hypothetical protein
MVPEIDQTEAGVPPGLAARIKSEADINCFLHFFWESAI